MWSWMVTAALSGGILLAGRWMLRIAKPADDTAALSRIWWRVRAKLREAWAVAYRAYGPVTDDMEAAWLLLRERYRNGGYGLKGT